MLLQHSRTNAERKGVTLPGFWRLSAATCSVLLGFCSWVLIARTLGPAAFGTYSFVLWLAIVAVPAIGVGMSTLASRHIAEIQSREMPRLAAGIFHFVWKRQARSILLYCLLYLLLAYPLSRFFGASAPLSLLLLAGLSAPPLLLSGVASITLRSLHRFDLLSAIHLLGAAVMLLLVVIATQLDGDLVGVFLLVSALAGTFTLTIALICIFRLLPIGQALGPGPLLHERLTRGLSNSLLLFTLDAIVWQRSELILLAHWRSTAELGFYALSTMINTRIMEIAPTLLSTCVLPLLLRYIPGQRYANAYDAFVKTTLYVAGLAIIICILAILFCPLVISFFFGNDYLPVVTPLRILLVSTAFGSIATISLTHLANGERKRAQIRLGTGAAVVNIVLSIPCIALWGTTGAAIASSTAQIASATGSILICRRYIIG